MILFCVLIINILNINADIHPSEKGGLLFDLSLLNKTDFISFYQPDVVRDPSYTENIKPSTSNEAIPRILNMGMQGKRSEVTSANEKPPLNVSRMKVVRQLAAIIESLWFQQTILLLDNTEEAHHDANTYLRDVLDLNEIHAELRLMKFNNSGVTAELANIVKDKQKFLNLLKYRNKDPTETTNLLAAESVEGGVVFYAVLKAARMLPEETAIIVFTDRRVEDEDLAQLAVKEMLQKNIKLYIVWGGMYPTLNNEDQLLQEAAAITEGKFIVGNTERSLSKLYYKAYLNNPDSKKTKAVVAFYPNITRNEQHSFPIDSGVTSIHISTNFPVAAMKLSTPKGITINVLNNTEVENLSEGSFSIFDNELSRYEIQLNIAENNTPTSNIGIWRLDVECTELHTQGCSVVVSVQTLLNVSTHVGYKLVNGAANSVDLPTRKKVLTVALSGEYVNINNISLLGTSGLEIKPNIMFTSQHKDKEPLMSTSEHVDANHKEEIDIDFNKLPTGQFYLQISGEDKNGKAFSRLSYFDKEKVNFVMEPITVEVGAGSDLLSTPNKYGRIFFEVTNNRDEVMHVRFLVEDERSLLSGMEPKASWISPRQTVIVTVTTYVSSAASNGLRDLLTFTASGTERVKKSAIVLVNSNIINDERDPWMTHKYLSDCTSILVGNCQDATWLIEVTVEDKESGLLQLTSNPKGLRFPNGYVSGTKEPVVGVYGSSCCEPKIQLTAIDVSNNRRTYTADAYNAALSAGSISAIVLGIILFLVILIVIILFCCKKCPGKSYKMELPVYKGTRAKN